ncbi:DNA-binding transcriptional MerR regulator [Microbacterium sp. SLBN-146]|nr:DNA-binding transcriptional MerR regulator [Microbacterium sp. SLBN-146]
MYTIGEFAALGRVSLRMLRHYDAIGLLQPARVDERTGYRFYAIDQLPLLLRIAELRELGVGLDRIAELSRADDQDAALRDVLDTRRRELEASVIGDRARIARIERRLRLLEGTAMSDVIYKQVDPVTVYAASQYAPGMGPENVGPVVGPLIGALDEALIAAGRPLLEPGIFWYDAEGDDRFAVHVSYVAEAEPVAGPGYDVVELPELPIAATLIHRGDMSGIGESWAALMEKAVADGYRVVGACREVYLEADGHVPGPDWVTELQAPVARV